MFGRKILFLAAWYVAGNIVWGVYGKYKKNTKKSSVWNKRWDVKQTAQNFIETQKAFLLDLEEKYIPEDKKKIFQEKKSAFLSAAESYMKKWEKFISEFTEKDNIQAASSEEKDEKEALN